MFGELLTLVLVYKEWKNQYIRIDAPEYFSICSDVQYFAQLINTVKDSELQIYSEEIGLSRLS